VPFFSPARRANARPFDERITPALRANTLYTKFPAVPPPAKFLWIIRFPSVARALPAVTENSLARRFLDTPRAGISFLFYFQLSDYSQLLLASPLLSE
jgi:hypothetical protein